jgi:uncharacterized membrane protein YbhN (UPF0104 family)
MTNVTARIPRWLKALVALALLGALATRLDLAGLREAVQLLSWPVLGVTLLLYPVAISLNAVKWSASLRVHDLTYPLGYLFRAGCIGFFVNNLLPSAIGGDIYRVYRTRSAGTTSQAVSAVLVERVVGLTALLLNGMIGALLLMESSALARGYVLWGLIGLVAVAAASIVYTFRQTRVHDALALMPRLAPLDANLRRVMRRHGAWLPLIGASVAFQLCAAAATYLAFVAVGADLSFPAALLVTAASGLAAVVPISIAGIGVIEGSIVGVAVALGVGYDTAFLAAIVLRAFSLLTSLGCGAVYVLDGGRAALRSA